MSVATQKSPSLRRATIVTEELKLFPRLNSQSAWWLGLSWLLLGLPTLIYPFGRDQGVFAYIGERLFNGARLYVDLWDVKSPLVYWAYGLALKLTDSQFYGVRLMDMLLAAASVYLVYALTINLRIVRGQHVGVVAGVLYLLWYYLPNDYRVLANCESFITPFLLLGMLLVVKAVSQPEQHSSSAQNSSPNYSLWFWAGMALGSTMLFKTTGAVYIVPAVAAAFFVSTGRTMKTRLLSVLAVGIGFAAPLVLGWMYLLRTGAMEDWLYLNFTYLPSYTSVSHSNGLLHELANSLFILKALIEIYPAMIIGLVMFSCLVFSHWCKRNLPELFGVKKSLTTAYIVLTFGLIYAAVIALQGKYLHYHFLPLLGPFAVLVAVSTLSAIEDFGATFWTKTMALLTLTIGLAHIWALPQRYISLGKMVTDSSYSDIYYEELSTGNYPCAISYQIGKYLRADSEPDDRLFVWSFEPEIYFLSELGTSSRFLFNTPFFAGEVAKDWKTELMVDLLSKPPTYIIIGEQDGLPLITGESYSSKERLKEIEGLPEFIELNYAPMKTFGNLTILKRRIFGDIENINSSDMTELQSTTTTRTRTKKS